jgi:hypothetical protein
MSYGSVHELITKARYRAYLLSLTRARQRLHPPRHPATAAMKSAITILSLQLLINFNSKSAIKTWRGWGIVPRIDLRTIEVSVRFTLWPHYPRGKNSCTHFVEGWGVDPRIHVDATNKESLRLSEVEPQFDGRPGRNVLVIVTGR